MDCTCIKLRTSFLTNILHQSRLIYKCQVIHYVNGKPVKLCDNAHYYLQQFEQRRYNSLSFDEIPTVRTVPCNVTQYPCTLVLKITTTLSYMRYTVQFVSNANHLSKGSTPDGLSLKIKKKYIFICTSWPHSTYESMPLWKIQTTELGPIS